ncbi:MAG: M23 family metallopeptidase [Anaerolineae bacterium]|nr:M23 family metallopeptidase [Candidatus Roseilinea sp.]MDW8448392.1 M23 family metallopeptidase [Anaerolineae bacterium]
MNGPAQRGGIAVFMAKVYASYMLAFLNPIQLVQMVMQGFGQLVALVRTRGAPPDTTYAQKTRYTLPVRGEWFVYNGGVTPETSHSWDVVAQRYAYDFVITDASLMRHRGDGNVLEDYFCYGSEVLSPADGEVISVRDGIRDAPRPGSGWLDFLALDFRGNHVVIKHAEGEYSFLAHLIPGSICMRKGDRVQRGAVIGRCGNSSHSTEPHLHFHVQDHANVWITAGVPVKFDSVVIADAPQPPIHLVRGTHVSPRACETITA